ncbi:MAG: hypothetical protein ACYS26_18950, partial [Planctomycetota bacterium]
MRLGLLMVCVALVLAALAASQGAGIRGAWTKTTRAVRPVWAAESPLGETALLQTEADRAALPKPPAASAALTQNELEPIEAVSDLRAGRLRILRADGTWDAAPDG